MMLSLKLLLAYLVDRGIGDPRFIPHPVVIMGNIIRRMEPFLRRMASSEKSLRRIGLLYPLCLVGGSGGIAWGLITGLEMIHPWLSELLEIWLISTTIASKGLADAGMEVYHKLREGNLQQARASLSMIVGRDTEHLEEKEVVRGAVETVAENMVDAIISPLFYAAVGGAPFALAYRAANTLDSMVGYKNERYQNLGWASARLDDVLNFIPARITGILIVLLSFVYRLDAVGAWRTMGRDAGKHPSPNSGIPEAGVAGALGIRLGGLNRYQGVESFRAYLGEPHHPLRPSHIVETVHLMYGVANFFILFLSSTLFLLGR
ncbi:MAG: cobalamin biosynthesis protein CobD [Thermicanus sp.]|nr:cobalamin biosynthesis protein CobD [Thermicanus sp.]